ncbi:MAG TPA: hypothetical protein DEO71_00715 [Chryseobacterium sp.]|nr:hypothetical protein [Chryseobacterium sp.]
MYSQQGNMAFYFKNFPQAPSTSTFLRYGDIQNSEFTGTNSTRIPIYTIQEGDITLPLTLDYTSGNGIKVADPSSSVGLGWNLGIPSVVQSVFGKDDFDLTVGKLKIDLHYQPTTPWGVLNTEYRYLNPEEGKPEPPGYIDEPQIGRYTYYYSINKTVPVNGFFQGNQNWSEYDASPDIFTLNLFGEKIEFFISNHKNINTSAPFFTCLKSGYKISFDKPAFKFSVTAPDGIIYEFGKNEEVKMPGIINRNFVLTKIVDKNSNTLNIDYNNYSGPVLNFIPQSKTLNYNRGMGSTLSPGCGGVPVYWGAHMTMGSKFRTPELSLEPYAANPATRSYMVPDIPGYYSTQNQLMVSKISGAFGNTTFTYTDREDSSLGKISNIIIKNSNSQKVKNIDFVYQYATAPDNIFQNPEANMFQSGVMSKRLILKEMITDQRDRYGFDYYDLTTFPRRDSYAVDYWGFYNGGVNNQTYFLNPSDITIQAYNQLPITYLNNNTKVSNINFAKAGLLKKITYPTQGYSLYKYELNAADNLFSNVPFNINQGKGVRLESQENYDFNSALLEKTKFIYEDGYSTNSLSLIKEFVNKTYSSGGYFNTFTIISMNSSNNLSTSPLSSGDYVGYKKVTKIQVDGSGNEKGRIISNYSISPDYAYNLWQDQLPVSIPTTKSGGIENGKLLSQAYLDNNGIKIREIINQYDTKLSDIHYGTIFQPISESMYVCRGWTNGGSIPAGSGTPDASSTLGLSVVAHYPVFSKESLLSNSKVTDYLNSKESVTKTKQYFNGNNFLKSKETEFPDGNSSVQNIKYSTEKDNLRLVYANIVNVPMETSTTYGNNGTNKTISHIETRYDNTNHLNPTLVSSYNLEGGPSSSEVTYDIYDSGRLLQYTTKYGIPITIIWGYNKTQPIAKIEGGNYSQVMQAFGLNGNDSTTYLQLDIVKKSDLDIDDSTEGTFVSVLNNFRNKDELKQFKITTFTYDPLVGVKTITQPSGLKEIYKYDTSGRLERVLDHEDKVIKEYKYNYGPVRYYSSAKSEVFIKNNCGPNSVGSSYTYSVPEGIYISTVSQADADQQAQNDINTNGQNQANSHGYCTPVEDCGFVPVNLISTNVLTKSVKKTANKIDFNLSFSPKNINNSWSTTTLIGNIPNPTCRPLSTIYSTYSSGGKSWYVTTQADGSVLINLTQGTVNNTQFIPPIDIIYSFIK